MYSKIELMCDDKNVGRILRSLIGLAVGAPTVLPVINAEAAANGSVKPKTNGQGMELFKEWVKKKKIKEIDATLFKQFCVENNFAESSYSHIRNQSVEHGIVKQTGKGHGAKYTVVLK